MINATYALLNYAVDHPGSDAEREAHYELTVQEIKRIHRATKATILYVTHDQSEAMALADRIIVMNDGQVDGFGAHEELLANNQIYREVYESQTQGGGDFDEKGGV